MRSITGGRSYRWAARQAVSMSLGPYGYTVTIWTSGGVLIHTRGAPSGIDALLFMLGAVGGYARPYGRGSEQRGGDAGRAARDRGDVPPHRGPAGRDPARLGAAGGDDW